jgi:hypothetical protein
MQSSDNNTIDPILYEFLDGVVQHIYRTANEWAAGIREAAQDTNPNRLIDRLVEIQGATVDRINTYLDGQSAPSHWPPLGIVNLESSKLLSGNLARDLAIVEGNYIISHDTD